MLTGMRGRHKFITQVAISLYKHSITVQHCKALPLLTFEFTWSSMQDRIATCMLQVFVEVVGGGLIPSKFYTLISRVFAGSYWPSV